MSNTQKTTAEPHLEDLKSSFARAFQQLVNEIFRLNGQLLTIGDQLSKDVEVSTARWQVMAAVRTEVMTVADIARRLKLKRQSVRETAHRLQQQDLITFQPNPRHSRAPLVQLTQQGQEVINVLRGRQLELAWQFMQSFDLSIEEIDEVTKRLRKIQESTEQFDVLNFITDSRKKQP